MKGDMSVEILEYNSWGIFGVMFCRFRAMSLVIKSVSNASHNVTQSFLYMLEESKG
jgi:hypothetical protein